ncbi:MAG: transcriptional repressor NrdR [Firmicutes bacterium]|nr:transcriptional repressor NrdR [Bacillota bacterium]
MRCPYCNFLESKVVDSRRTEDDAEIRRRRECLHCQNRFTTYERVEKMPIIVVKKNGAREIFDGGKLLRGLIKACEKRPVSVETLEHLVDNVEKEIRNQLEREVTSQQIGELVMDRLRTIDEVAYVRFASVYRQFSDVGNFLRELESLVNKQGTGNTNGSD